MAFPPVFVFAERWSLRGGPSRRGRPGYLGRDGLMVLSLASNQGDPGQSWSSSSETHSTNGEVVNLTGLVRTTRNIV